MSPPMRITRVRDTLLAPTMNGEHRRGKCPICRPDGLCFAPSQLFEVFVGRDDSARRLCDVTILGPQDILERVDSLPLRRWRLPGCAWNVARSRNALVGVYISGAIDEDLLDPDSDHELSPGTGGQRAFVVA